MTTTDHITFAVMLLVLLMLGLTFVCLITDQGVEMNRSEHDDTKK